MLSGCLKGRNTHINKENKMTPISRRLFLLAAATALLAARPAAAAPKKPPAHNARPAVAIALGGGAAKGFAHIGVLKVLHEHGIPVDIVTGTSAGAVVGSLFASGMDAARLQHEAAALAQTDVVDLDFSGEGFIKGDKLQSWIDGKVGHRTIERLPVKFAAVATDAATGRMAVLDKGNTGLAVRASASIPGVFRPVDIGNRRYVDGGLSAPVPVSAAKALGADIVIAVDISARPAHPDESGNFLAFIDQSLNAMPPDALARELAAADIVIKPQVQKLGAISGFEQKAQAVKLGEAAARKALPQIKAALAKYGRTAAE